ncbi:conserved hypothetical protein [Leishmania major strain Friedlin]|uniref:Uncharacterized protein n=1 Tax=Leishmania major TaxID=5664 RepID=Q4QJ09_LEIMA|nr:conserved hypothetical protein [Leishmania major strain Friedlin]CAG9568864.1 hypothetical_protein_-_conserved [Leishmania major strain Friedlin]CAJ02114.1 conserved hypothetical protein [Leishmania major strain Friedlin]|eukprot:XP_001680839.1 conserved hypothetical protein [Leishmania major strain Friedlin]
MIRVFAKTDVPVMDIIELQGKIVITEEALRAARDAKERRRASRRERRRRGAANSDTAVGEDASGTGDDLMPLSSAPSSSYPSSSCSSSRSSNSTGGDDDDEGGDRATADPGELVDVVMPWYTSHNSGEQRGAADSTSTAASALRGTSSPGCPSPASPRRPRPNSPTASRCAAVVEVPLGHVEQDRLDEKRCTLCIETLRVHGSRSSFKRPWLVLRECTPARMRKLRRQMARSQISRDITEPRELLATGDGGGGGGGGAGVAEPADGASSSPTSETTILFSEWLGQHPEALSLNSLFLDDFATGDGDDVSTRRPTAADPACAALASASSGRSGNGVGARKRPREAENVEGTVLGGPPFSPQLPQSASDVPSAAQTTRATAYKDYELVGVVRGSVLFNSKPARVFQ